MTLSFASSVLLPGNGQEFERRWRNLVAEFGGTVNEATLQIRGYSQDFFDVGLPMQLNIAISTRGLNTVGQLIDHTELELLTKFHGIINYGRLRQIIRVLAARERRLKDSVVELGDQIEQLTKLHLDIYTMLKKAHVDSLTRLLEMDILQLDRITRGHGPSVAKALHEIDRTPRPLRADRTIDDLSGWSFEALRYLTYKLDMLVSSITVTGLLRDLTTHFEEIPTVIDEEGIRAIVDRFLEQMTTQLYTTIPA